MESSRVRERKLDEGRAPTLDVGTSLIFERNPSRRNHVALTAKAIAKACGLPEDNYSGHYFRRSEISDKRRFST